MELSAEKTDPCPGSVGDKKEQKKEAGLFCQELVFKERADLVLEKTVHVIYSFRTWSL
jgi:hypothetical protein